MKIFHASDLHYCAKYLEEVDRCFSYAVDQATAQGCDVAVLSGDTFDHHVPLHCASVARALDQVQRLADHMPTLILQGTFSHDFPGSIDVFRRLRARYPIHVADKVGQVLLSKDALGYAWEDYDGGQPLSDAAALFSCLPPVNKAALAAMVGAENAAAAAGDYVAAILKDWSASHIEARENSVPAIVVGHGTVNGCQTEHGVPMAGLDHEFSVGTLGASSASAAMVGHIHKHQAWQAGHTVIAYPGSIGRLHYGERDPKGFLIWEFDDRAADASFAFHETPAKRLLEIEFSGTPDLDELRALAVDAADAHVRIRYSVDEEHRHAIDRSEIEALFFGAAAVKIEGRINPIQRQRAAGITQSVSLADKLAQWCELTETEPQPLTERLTVLEQGEAA